MTRKKIFPEAIRENPSITIAKLADVIGIAERNIKRNLRLLQDAGVVKRVGSSRKGYWTILFDNRTSVG
ncbi:MAG: winged helix-turn-helix transcriptional regulator [Clostridiales Family XIII bacterium]|jgi:predicted HTH transcriptional regulator|nr:winged helix-turn-helix transcriptional regulator [Clostridiales Family XIII bacterium]